MYLTLSEFLRKIMSVEYKRFVLGKVGYKNDNMIEAMNKLGADGWIIVGGTLQEHDYEVGWTAIFYRNIIEDAWGK